MNPLCRTLLGALVMSSGFEAPAYAEAEAVQTMTMVVGQARLITEPNLRRIAVGNGKVLMANALDHRQVLLTPESPGTTTLHTWATDGTQKQYRVVVYAADVQRVASEVQDLLGSTAGVSTRVVGDQVILEGDEGSDETAHRVAEVKKRYPQVSSLIHRQGAERMIAMDVRIAELKKAALENLGVDWQKSITGPLFGIVGDMGANRSFRPTVEPSVFGSAASASLNLPNASGVASLPAKVRPFQMYFGWQSALGSMLNVLAQNGDAVLLAEPRLSCKSGGSAKFLAGGEVPIPVTSGLGQSNVIFKPYGIKFEIAPVVNRAGVISAKVLTELSSIDPGMQVAGLPAFLTRTTATEVNLRENETLVISGLVSEETSRNIDKVAGLGDIPVLGKLFSSKDFRDRRSELVVFVTPRLISADSERNKTLIEKHESDLDESRRQIRGEDMGGDRAAN